MTVVGDRSVSEANPEFSYLAPHAVSYQHMHPTLSEPYTPDLTVIHRVWQTRPVNISNNPESRAFSRMR